LARQINHADTDKKKRQTLSVLSAGARDAGAYELDMDTISRHARLILTGQLGGKSKRRNLPACARLVASGDAHHLQHLNPHKKTGCSTEGSLKAIS
jgi:hypothetical protein